MAAALTTMGTSASSFEIGLVDPLGYSKLGFQSRWNWFHFRSRGYSRLDGRLAVLSLAHVIVEAKGRGAT
jgi:hypothetical protein